MDKKALKTVLGNLVAGQEVNVSFRGDMKAMDGSYRVVEVKTGRGKGGSKDAHLVSMADNATALVLRTKTNDQIFSLTTNGETFGGEENESANATRTVYPKDELRSIELATMFKTFNEGDKVIMTSTLEPKMNGTFMVLSAKAGKGKGRQMVLTVQDDNGNKQEVWSYRHSRALETIEKV